MDEQVVDAGSDWFSQLTDYLVTVVFVGVFALLATIVGFVVLVEWSRKSVRGR